LKNRKDNSDEVLDIAGAADYLKTHPETIRRLARTGKIPAYKVGRMWRINRGALQRWAADQSALHARVLVVDDEEPIRDIMRRALRREGYRVTCAASGGDALECMQRETPDVVLLDLKLPGMSGPDVLKQIRMSYGDLPVIIVTGHPDGELMVQAMVHSPLLLLHKPVSPTRVLQSVRMVLSGSRK